MFYLSCGSECLCEQLNKSLIHQIETCCELVAIDLLAGMARANLNHYLVLQRQNMFVISDILIGWLSYIHGKLHLIFVYIYICIQCMMDIFNAEVSSL